MDAKHFDTLTRALTEAGTRRCLLGLLATLPVLGGLVALLDLDEVDAKGRRKRRKKAHKHGKGRRRKHHKKCQADSKSTTCAGGKCGPVTNNCKKTVDCGSCDCPEPCDPCFICQSGPNTPGTCIVDPEMIGESCGAEGEVCQADGDCVCIPVDPCTGSVCGTVTNNCGQSIICDPCPPIIDSFTAVPTTIDRGATPPETSTLSWATSNATTCSIDNGVGSVNCNDSLAVGPGATTTYILSASGAGGGPVTAQATVTVQYCHAIVSAGGVCPSGETEFCEPIPIDATSASHAQAACEACATDTCGSGFGPVGGAVWSSPGLSTFFFYSAAAGPICGGFVPQAGDIADFAGCLKGRWAPEGS